MRASLTRLLSTELFDGRYAGKVIQVDSSTTAGAEGDDTVRRLLAVESYDEPIEIVVHVNMLKEGWDVTNLYTIVPLRAANARTLIEQSIGRGLRLPYGRRTGVEPIDRLNIIAHDRFQEVIDEAGRGDSPIRMKVVTLSAEGKAAPLRSVAIAPVIDAVLGMSVPTSTDGASSTVIYPGAKPTTTLLSAAATTVARVAMGVIHEMSREGITVPTSDALSSPAVQAEIVRRVEALITPAQADLLQADPADQLDGSVATVVGRTVASLVQYTIDIPRIQILPRAGARSGYAPFDLDVSRIAFQPTDQQLVSRGLQSGRELLLGRSSQQREPRLENYVVSELMSYDDVSYDQHAELIHTLSSHVVAHLRSYLNDDEEVHDVLGRHAKAIAANVHAQMVDHFVEDNGGFEVIVRQGFTPLKPGAATMEGDVLPLQQTPNDLSRIATTVYGGFARCAYSHAKFQSNTERLLAIILERDALLWLRPVAGQFNIFYRRGVDHAEYIPDFAVKLANENILIETKRAAEINSEDVTAKAAAAVEWCRIASLHAESHGGKSWTYVLIPHDAVTVNRTLAALKASNTVP